MHQGAAYASQPEIRRDVMRIEGAELYYEVAGSGPTIVLMHAGMADSSMWDVPFWALAGDHRVLRYDRRGFGRSSPGHVPFSHRGDLHALLQRLGIEKAHLLGCSEGGAVAIDHALEYPDVVLSLLLVSSSVGGFVPNGRPPADLLALLALLNEERPPQANLDQAAELAVRLWLDGPERTPDMLDDALRTRVRDMSRVALRTVLPGTPQELPLVPPALDRLHEIAAPTLIVTGDLDDPMVSTIAGALETGIDNVRRVVIHGAAHLPSLERPARFHRLVTDFLAQDRTRPLRRAS